MAATLVVAACGGGDDESAVTTIAAPPETTPVTEPEPEPEATVVTSQAPTTTAAPEATTTTVFVEPVDDSIRQPLTGEIVETEADKNTRPALVVKIDNANAARQNHTGLAQADLVFEEIVEDNNTRFAAVFQTKDADPVGPIRSGRSQDVDILSSLNAPLFAWSGGNAGVTRLIADSFLTDLNASRGGRGYARGPGRAPNNLYNTTARLYEQTPADHPGPPEQQFTYVFPDAEFLGDAPVESFKLAMRRRNIEWRWDDEAGNFVRFMDGSQHVDKTYGQITAQNVIVLVADYKPSQIDARSPEAQTLGSGPVYIFSNGQVKIGRWKHGLAVAPFEFVDTDGQPIALTPGTTWVELAEYTNDPEGDESFIVKNDALLAYQAAAASAEAAGEEPPTPIIPVNINLLDPDAAPAEITIVIADF